jgi:hypothetical protein
MKLLASTILILISLLALVEHSNCASSKVTQKSKKHVSSNRAISKLHNEDSDTDSDDSDDDDNKKGLFQYIYHEVFVNYTCWILIFFKLKSYLCQEKKRLFIYRIMNV